MITSDGAPIPSAIALDSGLTDGQTGFAFNPVNGLFYGVIPDRLRGEIVAFDPKTDSLERIATIPAMFIVGAIEPLSQFYTAPVVSSDGRSLMIIAQSGGPYLPQSPLDSSNTTAGALVHLNIDSTNIAYGEFTPVYGMYEFGQDKDYRQQINNVSMQPLLAATPTGDVIFLVANFSVSAFNNDQTNYDIPGKWSILIVTISIVMT